jgi:hypothetical protein
MAWYNKVYYGAQAEKMWQLGFATSTFLTLVLIPAFFEYWMVRCRKIHEASVPTGMLSHNFLEEPHNPNKSELQRIVYAKLSAKQMRHTLKLEMEKL